MGGYQRRMQTCTPEDAKFMQRQRQETVLEDQSESRIKKVKGMKSRSKLDASTPEGSQIYDTITGAPAIFLRGRSRALFLTDP